MPGPSKGSSSSKDRRCIDAPPEPQPAPGGSRRLTHTGSFKVSFREVKHVDSSDEEPEELKATRRQMMEEDTKNAREWMPPPRPRLVVEPEPPSTDDLMKRLAQRFSNTGDSDDDDPTAALDIPKPGPNTKSRLVDFLKNSSLDGLRAAAGAIRPDARPGVHLEERQRRATHSAGDNLKRWLHERTVDLADDTSPSTRSSLSGAVGPPGGWGSGCASPMQSRRASHTGGGRSNWPRPSDSASRGSFASMGDGESAPASPTVRLHRRSSGGCSTSSLRPSSIAGSASGSMRRSLANTVGTIQAAAANAPYGFGAPSPALFPTLAQPLSPSAGAQPLPETLPRPPPRADAPPAPPAPLPKVAAPGAQPRKA